MPKNGRKIIKITKAVVDQLELTAGRQVYYWDAELPGFGLYVGATAKSYFAQRTMGGRGRNRKTVRITIGKHGIFTPEEARREARDLLNRMARGEDPRETRRLEEDQSITLREAWEQFSAMRTTLAKSTRNDYKRTLTRDLAHWLDRPLASISGSELVQEYTRQTADRSPSTAARNMRTFRSIYNFAMALHEHLPQNPADRLKKLRLWYRDPRRRTYIRPDQLPYWYAAVMRLENDHARDYLRLLLFTGMRRSEGLSLRWEHVDFSGLTLTVPRTKNGDPLILPLSTFLYELLHERRRRFPGRIARPGPRNTRRTNRGSPGTTPQPALDSTHDARSQGL